MSLRTTIWSLIVALALAAGSLLPGALRPASSAGGELAKPPERGGETLLECLWARRSTRSFADAPLPEGALSRILWCADGINRADAKKRTAPSAFSAYPVALYVVEATRVSRYDPEKSALLPVRRSDADPEEKVEDLRALLLGESSFAGAPVILVLVADYDAFEERVDKEMRPVWTHAECGAIGQNVYLACADLGLGTVFAAVMDPEAAAGVLLLETGPVPCYLMPVGVPAARE